MKRPVFLLFIGLVLGEAASIFLNRAVFLVIALFLLIFIFVISKIIKKKRSYFFIFGMLFFCLFIIGGVSFYRTSYLDGLDRKLSKKDLGGTLSGQVEFVRQTPEEEYLLTIRQASFGKYKLSKKVRILKIPVSVGKIYPGDWVICTGKLSAIESPVNPGQFDSKIYYYSTGIKYQFFGEKISRKRERPLSFYRITGSVREKIDAVYQKILSPKEHALLKAIFLGDKSDLSKDQKALYQDSGAMHLLAVSGLHVSIIGGMLFRFLRKRGCSYAVSCTVASGTLLFYAIMTGMGNSVFRASVMFLCFLMAQYFGAEYDLVSSMSLAGILMLLDCPWRLLESGCIISFVSVFSIGMLLPFSKELEEKRRSRTLTEGELLVENKWRKKIRQAFFANLILALAITPLLLRFYYQWSPYSIFLNLFIIPAMNPLLLSAITGGILGIVSQIAGFLGCTPAVVLLKSFEGLFHIAGKMPGAVIVTGCPSWWTILLIYLLEVLFFLLWYYKLWGGNIVLIFLLISGSFFRATQPLKITMLDVGQGECLFLKLPTGENILIDGGSTSKKNVADSVIIPALKYYGTNHLDYVIITHTDEDHISGIRELFEQEYPVKNVILSDIITTKAEKSLVDKTGISTLHSDEMAELKEAAGQPPDRDNSDIIDIAKKKKYTILKISRGDRMDFDRIHFRCLHPQRGWTAEDVNSGSIVLYLTYEKFTMLFTGDLNGEQEPLLSTGREKLLLSENNRKNNRKNNRRGSVPITILKTAHHGSKNSTTESFLKDYSPQKAIISAGKNNLYGHPHKETLGRLQRSGADIYGTLWGGAILIESDGQDYQIKYW